MEIHMSAIIRQTPKRFEFIRKGVHTAVGGPDPWDFSSVVNWTDSLTGQTLSDWRAKVKSGLNATTPMAGTEINIISTPSTYHYKGSTVAGSTNPAYQHEYVGTYSFEYQLPPSISVNSIDATVQNKAATKWNAKVFDTFTAFQGGVFLVELQQTLRLIMNPASSLRRLLMDYLRALKKRSFKGMKKHQIDKILAELWLEFVFGVKPLLSDIQDASSLLKSSEERLKLEIVRVRASVGPEYIPLSRHSAQDGTYGCAAWSFVQSRGAAAQYVGAVASRCSPYTVILDSAGFSPRNFVPTVYECIPLSFILDYFTNIGTILESWSNQQLRFAWGSLTTKKFQTLVLDSFRAIPPALAEFKVKSHSFGTYYAERKSVNRSSITSAPFPDLAYKIPGIDTKWLNLAALVVAKDALNFRR
jgi:hypothetical protein